MKGPPPKNPATRQRANRAVTAATLAPEAVRKRTPALPRRELKGGTPRPWHPLTRAWWRDVWRSPMAAKFLRSDTHGLYLLADLVDRFWNGDVDRANEIRLQCQRFGLSPIDRWRLQWNLLEVPPEVAERPQAPAPPPAEDPRLKMLRAVK